MGVFLVVGCALFVGSLRELARRLRRSRRLVRAEGVVVSLQTKKATTLLARRTKTTHMHFPVIRYNRETGETATFTSETGDAGRETRFRVGQRVFVRYDPEGEVGPLIDSWFGLWAQPLLLAAGGVMFICGAALIYFAYGEKLGFKVFAGDQSQNWLIRKNGEHNIGLFQGMFDKNIRS